jgi:glutathione-regulated potassium-efflux system protein KefB
MLEGGITASMMAIVILSKAWTSLAVILLEELLPAEKQSMDGVESASDLHGRVLDVGSGRFAQFVSQSLLTKGIDVSIIKVDVQMIRAVGQLGFTV